MDRVLRPWLSMLLLLLLICLLVKPAAAAEISSGDMVYIPSGNMSGPLFVTGNSITVNANIDGDVYAAGSTITINGDITGDLLAAGNTIRVNGKVAGDIRAAGNTVDIDGQVGGSVTSAANAIGLRQNSMVGRDVLVFGNTIELSGNINRQVLGFANQMDINGPINGDIRLWNVEKLNIGPAAVIGGMITYNSANQAQIASGAKTGQLTRLEPTVTAPQKNNMPRHGMSWWGSLVFFAAGLLIWGALSLLFPRFFSTLAITASKETLGSLGWGFAALLLIPMAVLLFMITVIGIPLALIVLFTYIIILCLSKIILGDFLGRYIAERLSWKHKASGFLAFMLSFLILIIAGRIPMIGFLVNLVIASMALGIVLLSIYDQRRDSSPVPPDPSALNN